MPEGGKLATPAAAARAGKAAASGKRFSATILKLASDFTTLCKDTEGLQEYEKVLNIQADLQQKLEQKNEEIGEKNRAISSLHEQRDQEVTKFQEDIGKVNEFKDRLIHEYETRYADWESEKQRHTNDSAELSRLRSELETWRTVAENFKVDKLHLRKELGQCQEGLEKTQEKLTSLQEDYNLTSLQLKDVKKKLQKSQDTSARLERELGVLSLNEEEAGNRLEDLATQLSKLIHSHFRRELPDPSVRIHVSSPLSRIPQVASNSPAAQYIRCAFAEGVIAQELSRHIFSYFYIPDGATGVELDGLVKALTRLNKTHPHEAKIVRCQLAKACTELAEVSRIPTRAAESANATLKYWLNKDTVHQQQFLQELTALFSKAMDIWKGLQRSSKRVKAIAEITEGEWLEEEDSRREYDSIAVGEQRRTQQKTSQSMIPLAILFPQIVADSDVLFYGYALFPTQGIVTAAFQELSNETYPRKSSANPRRRTDDYESGNHQMETTKTNRRRNGASPDRTVQRSLLGTSSDSSRSSRANSRSVRETADRTASHK